MKSQKSHLAYSDRPLSIVYVIQSCVSTSGVRGLVVSFYRQNLHTTTKVCVLRVIGGKFPESREDVLPLSLG